MSVPVEVNVGSNEIVWRQNDLNLRISLQDLIKMAKEQFPEDSFSELYVSGSCHEDVVGLRDESTLLLERY